MIICPFVKQMRVRLVSLFHGEINMVVQDCGGVVEGWGGGQRVGGSMGSGGAGRGLGGAWGGAVRAATRPHVHSPGRVGLARTCSLSSPGTSKSVYQQVAHVPVSRPQPERL